MSDPAMANLGYTRVDNDFYPTPHWVTEAVINELPERIKYVWEPAAGKGHMVKVLSKYYQVTATDLVDYGLDHCATDVDFLKTTGAQQPHIITNPPYHLAEEFLRHAIALTKPVNGSVAMIMRNEFDCAVSRRDLFSAAPFSKKLILTKRPVWFEDTRGSPRHNYSWYIFDWAHQGDPVIKYSLYNAKWAA